jgi:hypothetical protein
MVKYKGGWGLASRKSCIVVPSEIRNEKDKTDLLAKAEFRFLLQLILIMISLTAEHNKSLLFYQIIFACIAKP